MAIRRIVTAVPANGTTGNILEAESIRFPGRLANLTVAATVPAAGADEIQMNCELGSDIVAKNATVPVERTTGGGPVLPDNLLVDEGVAPQDQIIITYTDTGGTGRNVTTFVSVD